MEFAGQEEASPMVGCGALFMPVDRLDATAEENSSR
jgi:hypothetical protein